MFLPLLCSFCLIFFLHRLISFIIWAKMDKSLQVLWLRGLSYEDKIEGRKRQASLKTITLFSAATDFWKCSKLLVFFLSVCSQRKWMYYKIQRWWLESCFSVNGILKRRIEFNQLKNAQLKYYGNCIFSSCW